MDPRYGLFGKLPCAGDFLSVGATTSAAGLLQRWLVDEVERLAGKRANLPSDPIRFLIRDPEGTSVALGVFGPSQDAVGRKFPLAVMTHLDAATSAGQFAWVPAAYAPFLDAAATLVRGSHGLDAQTLESSVQALPLPGPTEVDAARVWTHQALEATSGSTILEAVFGPLAGGVHYHGVHMFKTACARVRGRDPGQGKVVLECPAVDDVQLAFWLMLTHMALGWTAAPPSLFWTDVSSSDHRLLVCLGSPVPGVLHFLADPSATAERLWPMRTDNPAAIATARGALPPPVLAALEPPAPTAAALLAGLSG